jgi:hypothetical protein
MSTENEIQIDSRVTASLHPGVVDALDPDGVEAGVLAPTRAAFALAYNAISKMHTARAVASKDPTMTEATMTIAVADMGDRLMDKVTREFDSVRANLVKGIDALEASLRRPVEVQGAASVSAEIRAHIARMAPGERMEFLRKRIQAGDTITASAALGAPGYLSGIEDEVQTVLTRMFHERNSPDTARRLKAMQAARDLIEGNAPLTFKERDKAVGKHPGQVKLLRDAHAKTRAALA